ncbi:sigma 54-interacting transcriptional regulator [Heyndrickxia coagulans]|uniref:sigma-54 interaction domain-containing protein n=1 Tax=Heyndrickxia coagulans TaxID=1398 RepID=UPI002E1BE79A|nr:sigma 54-interacting transcriptional regulator [Heyndrickxia coagulans]MED4935579.1 sigma 54-interacting transcriptional regulator [Heyndrickxia coagulans]
MEETKDVLLALYETIMNLVDAGIHAVDEEGRTMIYNQKMRDIEGMDSREVLYKKLEDVFRFRSSEESTLLKALKTGEESHLVKQTYFNNKGREITSVNHTYPFYYKGKLAGAVEIAEDITKIERLIRRNHEPHTGYTFHHIIGKSKAISEVIEFSRRAARTSSYVLIIGETGTGKELFAQSIHYESERSRGPFIAQNCAALPDNLIESILFGTKKGAFTGALDRAGLFEQADGGTLLLDEINALNIHLQAKLLRVLQEKKVKRIGGTQEKPVDVRVIATMNETPYEAIANHRLRKDLYYRLGVVTLFIPPLRDRLEDLPLLTGHFIQKYNSLFQMNVRGITPEVLTFFRSYRWPGNIRELEHMIEAAMNVMLDEDMIELRHLPMQYRQSGHFNSPAEKSPLLKDRLLEYEKQCILEALEANGSNISKAAEQLGLSRQSLQYRMKRLGI